jgi:hypothetical protein
MPNNSSYVLQDVADIVSANGDTAPALATGGFSQQPMIQMANKILAAMLNGGASGQPMGWKWNRILVPPFPTISWQQDYFIPGLVQLSWLESAWGIQYSNTSQPKPKIPLECHKDLLVTYQQNGYPGKVCWVNNSQAQTGVWGDTELQTPTGQNNPGPGVIYTNPLTSTTQPSNPITNVEDSFGNLWTVTTYGTCGLTNPFLTNQNPTNLYPTLTNPTATTATVTDGTVVWTAINPNGQAIRLNPIPPQQGQVWQINIVGQLRITQFTTLTQSLGVVPDDYYQTFVDGCLAEAYRRNPDAKIRARFKDEWAIWLKSLKESFDFANKEQDDFGFYPSEPIMETGAGSIWLGPAAPYPGWPYYY